MLKESGKKVGVYTSPHNIDIRERFETATCVLQDQNPPNPLYTPGWSLSSFHSDSPVQGGMRQRWLIPEEDFGYYAEIIIEYGWGLSYFERCVLMAFLYFRDTWCEYAVIEVGMGGRLDATNIITPILSIITSISYDHMEFLGDTLEEIAYEKWGIIKPGIPVIFYGKNPTLESLAKEKSSSILFPKKRNITTNLLGVHQISNAQIAYEAWIFLEIETSIIKKALLHVDHHGRLEYIRPNLLIDGAHNEDGMRKLLEYLKSIKDNWEEIIYSFNLKEWKSASMVLDIFSEVGDWHIIGSNGFRVSNARKIAQDIESLWRKARIITPKEIFLLSSQSPKKLFVVFGSLYMMWEFLHH